MHTIERSRAKLAICLALTGVWLLLSMFKSVTSTPGQPSDTPTPTPTSLPGRPILLTPADGALLPQPVPPFQWSFVWEARDGPCYGSISITGPGGRHISYFPNGYHYIYSQTEFLPDDALAPWYWQTFVYCPLGNNSSLTRTFSVMPVYYMPLIVKDG